MLNTEHHLDKLACWPISLVLVLSLDDNYSPSHLSEQL